MAKPRLPRIDPATRETVRSPNKPDPESRYNAPPADEPRDYSVPIGYGSSMKPSGTPEYRKGGKVEEHFARGGPILPRSGIQGSKLWRK